MASKKFLALFVPFLTITLFLGTSLQLTQTTFPVYLTFLGVDFNWIGLYALIFSISSFAFRPLAGYLINHKGAKPVLQYGAGLYLATFLIYLLISAPIALAIVRILQGVGFSLTSTALGTLVLGILPEEKLTQGLGYYGVATSVSQTIGAAIGLQIIVGNRFENMFIAGIFLVLLSTLISLLLFRKFPDNTGNEKGKKSSPVIKNHPENQGWLNKLLHNAAVVPSVLVIIMMFPQSAIPNYLTFLGKESGLENVSFFFLANTAGVMAAKLFVGDIADRFGRLKTLICAGTLYTIVFLTLVPLVAVPVWSVLAVMYGMGYGGLYTLLHAEAVRNVPVKDRGTATALFYGSIDFGYGFGGLLWGIVGDAINVAAIFYGSAFLSLLLTILFAGYLLKKREMPIRLPKKGAEVTKEKQTHTSWQEEQSRH